MKLTVKFKILPSKEQEQYLEQTLTEYINTVNNIVQVMINGHTKLTSKDIKANLPSAVKNQAIRDAKSVYSKYKKTNKLPIWSKQILATDSNAG